MSYTIRLMPGTSLTMRVIGPKYHQSHIEWAKLLIFPSFFFFQNFLPTVLGFRLPPGSGYEIAHGVDCCHCAPLLFFSPLSSLFLLSHRCLVGGGLPLSRPQAQSRRQSRHRLPKIKTPGGGCRGSMWPLLSDLCGDGSPTQ